MQVYVAGKVEVALASLRLHKLTMRANAFPAALAALACLPLATVALGARPTHTVVREPSHRLVVPVTPARERAGRRLAAPHSTARTASAAHAFERTPAAQSKAARAEHTRHSAALHRVSVHAEERATVSRSSAPRDTVSHATAARVHAWEQTQRDEAARAAIASANQPHLADPEGDDPAPSTADVLLADNASTLLRTSPELPRQRSIAEEAATPLLLPSLYDKRGKLVVPAPLYGSHEVLLHQNQMADRDGLTRVHDDADLLDLRRDRRLVPLPAAQNLVVDSRLPLNRRYARPWTAEFLSVLARDFYASFHEPLQVNSAVRTVEFQQRLLRSNGNAAPAAGETASPHLTGQAVDIGKRGLSLPQLAWMRAYLQPLIEGGKIDVEEEFQQSCFHISVYRSFAASQRLTAAAARPTPPEPAY